MVRLARRGEEALMTAFSRGLRVAVISVLFCTTPQHSVAQTSPADAAQRPGGTPPLVPPAPEPRRDSPTIDLRLAPPPDRVRALAGPRFQLLRVELQGNTVLEAAAISEITRVYEGREIDTDEIEDLRLRLTRLYIDRGYVNSGVLVPDQDIADGVLRLRAVEGQLTRIEVLGEGLRLRPSYVESRLALGAYPVLNLNRLRERIEILQQDGPIERINAEIVPGIAPGEAVLRAQVTEARPYDAGIVVNNHRNTAVGELRAELFAAHRNLTGWGDRIEGRIGTTRGLDDYSLAYAVPVSPYDTTLLLSHAKSDALVIESTLRALDITNRSRTDSVGVEHPLWRTPAAALKVSLTREHRRSATFLLGFPFSFTPGVPDGGARAKLWRVAASWLEREPDAVLAARLQFTSGETNLAGGTAGPAAPASRFGAWLGQLHWGRRFAEFGGQVIARLEFQETRDVLLPLERYGLGGANTVRGFRENQLLRDGGGLASLEYRHPLLGKERPELQGAVFLDHGRSYVNDGTRAAPDGLSSIGVGFLWSPGRQAYAQIYFARGSRRFTAGERDWQDRGVHFSASYSFF